MMPEHRSERPFLDRRDAGRRLAEHLGQLIPAAPPPGLLVLGLPRGGVVVAAEVARVLQTELDVLVVRKVAHPSRPELALGAVTADGVYRNEGLLARLGIPAEEFRRLADEQAAEVRRREELFRAGRPALILAGRTVLLVDDGLATGATATAAVGAVRGHRPHWLGLAVPVASASSAATLAAEVDQLVCPVVPSTFLSVSRFYRDFPQTSDAQVRAILAKAGRGSSPGQ